MSESVQHHLETRVPELEDLFKKGIFSKDEIKDIVAKRTQYEYKIKRRCCRKEDFLTYINYECELEAVRKQRFDTLNIKGKRTISDYSIVKYIFSLYRRALIKFKGDVGLWNEYISFAEDAKAFKVISKIFVSALQMHPYNENLWIRAARFELERNNNPSSARSIFQRALRMNKESKKLWLEYFNIEMEISKQLATQQSLITDKKDREENESELTVYDGAIPISVFKFAMKTCSPDSTEAFEFYKTSQLYPELAAVSNFIDNFVSENIEENYKYFVLKARLALSNVTLEDESFLGNLEISMRQLNHAYSISQNSDVLQDVVDVLESILNISSENLELTSIVYEKLDQILQHAEENGTITPILYTKWMNFAMICDDKNSYQEIFNNACKNFPRDSTILLNHIERVLKETTEPAEKITQCIEVAEILKTVKGYPDEICEVIFTEFAKISDERLRNFAESIIISTSAPIYPLNYLVSNYGPNHLVKICDNIDVRKISKDFIASFVSLVVSIPELSASCLKVTRKFVHLNSSALCDPDTVLSIIGLELKHGDFVNASVLFEKAVSKVASPEEFSMNYETLKSSISIL